MAKSLGTHEFDLLRTFLADMRMDAGVTQRELAETLEVSRSWVAKVELGERRIDLVEFVWVCRALGVDPSRKAMEVVRMMMRSSASPKRR